MGLDITARSRLAPAPSAAVNDEGDPVDWGAHQRLTQGLIDFTEKAWPGRTEGLAPGVYTFGGELSFRAGSYSGYNEWRRNLARMAHGVPPEAVWRRKLPGPFVELISFSDCEGLIGPAAAAKLARDFAEWEPRAVEFAAALGEWDGARWLELYRSWRLAFELAADGGCVEFH